MLSSSALPSSGVTEHCPAYGGKLLRKRCSSTDSYEPGVELVSITRWFRPPTSTNGRRYKVYELIPATNDNRYRGNVLIPVTHDRTDTSALEDQ